MIDTYKKKFAKILQKEINMSLEDIINLIETPPENIPGDLAFPCFGISKILKKSPNDIAKELAKKLSSSSSFSSFVSVGGFLNAHINQSDFINNFFVSLDKGRGSRAEEGFDNHKIKVLIEYMSANPNKPLHIGQARNICIGDSMRRVYKYLGYTTHASDYGDDSGVNVGYNIVGHLHYDYPTETDMKYDHYCGKIYEEMRKKDEDPVFKKLLSKTLQNIEKGDPEILEIHQKYTKRCTLEQLKSCWRIGASFDLVNRETDILHLKFFAETMDLLREKGYVTFADKGDAKGCWIIDLSSLPEYAKEEKQYQILIKSDGVATYIAKDISFALRKLGYLKNDFYYHTFTHEPDGNIVYTSTSDKNEDHKDKFGNYNIA
ncbi:arginine--tRNA ligase, partial [Patescibacteria group bacterium]|nr:arginine--tRNA ligase [Patescibacteria group bacterium]